MPSLNFDKKILFHVFILWKEKQMEVHLQTERDPEWENWAKNGDVRCTETPLPPSVSWKVQWEAG